MAELVDGLTKLDKLQFNTREENQAESFRKMLLAMARDVRVILIKLADRSTNMRTLSDMPRSKWGASHRKRWNLRPHRPPPGPEPDLPRTAGPVLSSSLANRGATPCLSKAVAKPAAAAAT